jgi:cystathionine beta-lyase/cystathionine gamma-synthase
MNEVAEKLRRAVRIIGGALVGALVTYLAAVWMTGYFYSPLLHGARFSANDASSTRYIMLNGFVIGGIVAWAFSHMRAESDNGH